MLTRILKENNLEQLSLFIQNKDSYNLKKIIPAVVRTNKLEAYKLVYEIFINIDDELDCTFDFFKDSIFAATEYKSYNVISFIINKMNEHKIHLDSENVMYLFSLVAKHKKMISFLSKYFELRESYIPYIIFRLNNSFNKRTKNTVYKMTDFYISIYGSFPSKELFEIIKKHDSFYRINCSYSNSSDFKFHDYLLKYDKENYIIKKFKAFNLNSNNEIYDFYVELNKKLNTIERVKAF